ncbi:uncharacterized protein BJX67DRAFT_367908 [Aspergillus lucknowensis]|uniref:Uncharacterized protein n=1 Tax=Aspergillus lucknowensis TaxID=176173 RepID=A0ABR4L8N2_9EURO
MGNRQTNPEITFAATQLGHSQLQARIELSTHRLRNPQHPTLFGKLIEIYQPSVTP